MQEKWQNGLKNRKFHDVMHCHDDWQLTRNNRFAVHRKFECFNNYKFIIKEWKCIVKTIIYNLAVTIQNNVDCWTPLSHLFIDWLVDWLRDWRRNACCLFVEKLNKWCWNMFEIYKRSLCLFWLSGFKIKH